MIYREDWSFRAEILWFLSGDFNLIFTRLGVFKNLQPINFNSFYCKYLVVVKHF